MEFYKDDDATPRPLRVTNMDEWAERSPYIPRRKTSHRKGPVHAASTIDLARPSQIFRHENASRHSYLQKARFPIDGHDPPPRRALPQPSLLVGPGMRRPQSTIPPSSSRRFFNRMFSNLAFPSNASRRQSRDSNSSKSKIARTHRETESESSSKSSPSSLGTAMSSLRASSVRRRRQLPVDAVQSAMSDSPNPLRAPPSSLLGSTQGNSVVSDSTDLASSTTGSSVESWDVPKLVFAEVQYLTFAGNDQLKNGMSCSVWVVLKVLCSADHEPDKETFAQQRSGNRVVNDPGFLNSVGLAISPIQHCQITAALGRCTASILSPNETIIAIALVELDKASCLPTELSPRNESGRLTGYSSRNRPTSDVLSDELLNQLLGTSKMKTQTMEEKVEGALLKAKITYDHSLLPPFHQISYEVTINVKPATTCNRQQNYPQKDKQKRGSGYLQRSDVTKLTCEQTKDAANSIIRVLSEGLRSDGNSAAPNDIATAGQAVRLLSDFSAASTRLSPDSKRTLEMLRFRYSVHVNICDEPMPSPKRYKPFERRKEERRESSEPKSPWHARFQAELDNKRRNAFEMDRAEMENGLSDVTNLTRYRSDSPLRRGTHLPGYDCTTDFGKENAVPLPLFSPRKEPTEVHSPMSEFSSTDGTPRTPKYSGCHTNRQHLQNNIGSPGFYAAEVEDMARQAFGGAITCHHRNENLHESIENEKDVDHYKIEEDANEKARQIWRSMRISSEGSGSSTKSSDAGYSDESADDAERARECKVVGAPWLA